MAVAAPDCGSNGSLAGWLKIGIKGKAWQELLYDGFAKAEAKAEAVRRVATVWKKSGYIATSAGFATAERLIH